MSGRTDRLAKAALVAMAGAYALLAGIDNVVDFEANLPFVQHVLMMDTTFRDPAIMWRAIQSSTLQYVAFGAIILCELLVGLGGIGAATLMAAGRSDAMRYATGRRWAIVALTLAIALWMGGFLVIAGEWFAMWQSQKYNAQAAAFQYVVPFLLILGIVMLPEAD